MKNPRSEHNSKKKREKRRKREGRQGVGALPKGSGLNPHSKSLAGMARSEKAWMGKFTTLLMQSSSSSDASPASIAIYKKREIRKKGTHIKDKKNWMEKIHTTGKMIVYLSG